MASWHPDIPADQLEDDELLIKVQDLGIDSDDMPMNPHYSGLFHELRKRGLTGREDPDELLEKDHR